MNFDDLTIKLFLRESLKNNAMETFTKNNICEVLSEAIKFSKGIDKHVRHLGLNPNEVASFKNDVELLRVIIEHSKSFTEGFVSYNAVAIQWRLTALIVECTTSENFTNEIGEELGIKIPLENIVGLNPIMNLNWGMERADMESIIY